MPDVEVAGARLHYRLEGRDEAPCLVLAHSLGADLASWDPQIKALTAAHRVLRYDCRGHGRSDVTPAPYDIDRLARDVLSLMDAIGIARARFCGLSIGGMVGMRLARLAPQRVERLVLANTAARIGPPRLWDERIARVREGGVRAIADAVLDRWFTPEFRRTAPAAVARARTTLEATAAEGYIACCAAVRDFDERAQLSAVCAPTLVIAGAHDRATPPADGRFLAERIAGARYRELPAAHLSNLEAEEEFTSELVAFLS